MAQSNNLNKAAQKLGKRGGQKTASLYGKEHMRAIGKKGGWPKGKSRKKALEQQKDKGDIGMKKFKHIQSQKEYAANGEAEEHERRQSIAMGDNEIVEQQKEENL